MDVVAGADRQRSLEHIPGLIFCVLVQRGLVEGLVSAALRRPLGEHELGTGRRQGSSGELLRRKKGGRRPGGLGFVIALAEAEAELEADGE